VKEIKAYIRRERADTVIQKLEEAGVTGMTVLDANALAEWADEKSFSFSIEYVQKYSTVVKIELICEDNEVDKLASVIANYGKTGTSGDGWVFVSNIEKSIRIKTGEVDLIK
jgi:nitrogen regulatory protein P-II 1